VGGLSHEQEVENTGWNVLFINYMGGNALTGLERFDWNVGWILIIILIVANVIAYARLGVKRKLGKRV